MNIQSRPPLIGEVPRYYESKGNRMRDDVEWECVGCGATGGPLCEKEGKCINCCDCD